ncbi:S-adenosyl-L-methionine-dependent methyltransferases superfamily protein [Actinidia rufa]|uniref:Methyltransferase n=1 Tax=Actinidia rufa TaxID=165716 RepID=A0A7J0FTJ8_9ERIC|nr:S-adenosyl-L-methionine-dependent methyltransferases superfamily protein [Actinidia rufa]
MSLPHWTLKTHHNDVPIIDSSEPKAKVFKPCDDRYTDYTPCQEQDRAMTFPRENMIYRERHCPPEEEKLHCLIPAPKGYTTPFSWPKSRDYVYYANVPHKSLTVEKAVQNWVQFQGNVFKFPGGGTMFPQGADAYIDELASVIPIADGSVRTALDTGCGLTCRALFFACLSAFIMLPFRVYHSVLAASTDVDLKIAPEDIYPSEVVEPQPDRLYSFLDHWQFADSILKYYIHSEKEELRPGVASWGAYLLKRNVLAMSFAPKDNHEEQVQFALERGVPAIIGVLGTIRLPYPSSAFDMAQCSRCLIPWTANDGMYLMEVDRVLRPGGYWILSGPPINWKTYYKTWKRSKEDLKAEQRQIEELAENLCWEKKYEKGDIAIWRKKVNAKSCRRKFSNICKSKNADDVWYKKMEACITPFPASVNEVAGGELKRFPARLFAVPPRIAKGSVPGVTVESYHEDNKQWKKHVNVYKKIVSLIGTTRYRNIMDMNAGLGGFAAALESRRLWVMNVVPTIAENTLGVVYERGLIGIYHDWCEGFSTYPRTYDLIHASGVFSMYQDKCELEDILLEMDRILRPEGTVIFRDEVDVLNKVRKIVGGMRWETKMNDHDDGPLVPEKILVATKQYWVGSGGNSTSSNE